MHPTGGKDNLKFNGDLIWPSGYLVPAGWQPPILRYVNTRGKRVPDDLGGDRDVISTIESQGLTEMVQLCVSETE